MSFGKRLAIFRGQLGFDQETMAARLGVKLRTYQGYERDETEPQISFVRSAIGLGCDAGWLITGVPTVGMKQSQTPAESAILDRDALVATLEMIGRWLRDNQREMTPAQHANAVAAVYEIIVEDKNDLGDVPDERRMAQIIRLFA